MTLAAKAPVRITKENDMGKKWNSFFGDFLALHPVLAFFAGAAVGYLIGLL